MENNNSFSSSTEKMLEVIKNFLDELSELEPKDQSNEDKGGDVNAKKSIVKRFYMRRQSMSVMK